MKLFHRLALASALCIVVGAEARADYMDAYNSLTTPEARTVLDLVRSRTLDTNYMTVDQRILSTYLADPKRAKILFDKQASGVRLTGGETRGLAVINNAASLISTMPRPGQLGYNQRRVFYGN